MGSYSKQMVEKPAELVKNIDSITYTSEEGTRSPNTETNPHKQNPKKRGNEHLSTSDFDQLAFHMEKCLKNQITNSFNELKKNHQSSIQTGLLNSGQQIASLQREKEELEGKIRELEEQRTENQTKFEALERKIAELENDKTKKTCVACSNVIDSLAYCNSECLK